MFFDLIGFLALVLVRDGVGGREKWGRGNGEERESVEEIRGEGGVWYYKQRWSFRFTPWIIVLFEKWPRIGLGLPLLFATRLRI